MLREKSESIYRKSCAAIPGGVNSPVRAFGGLGISPLIVQSGKGDLIQDVDGYSFIDYCLSWGPMILGHAYPAVVNAVCRQMAKGSSFGIATEAELKLAEKIRSFFPSIEKIRFVSSGTEATMTAIRIARAYTDRPKIIKFIGHYHGHHDALLVQAGSGVSHLNPTATSKGVFPGAISDTLLFPFNDLETLRFFFHTHPMASQVAAVIVEPVAGNMGVVPPEPGFLEMLREETARIGALLIFDEVMSGFRVAPGGAQQLFQINPDLTCLGKVIGGGFPVAAVGGKASIMDRLAPLGEVYQAGTLSGNPVAMEAGLATLSELEKVGFYDDLFAKTDRLVKPIQDAIERVQANACVQKVGSMFTLFLGCRQVKNREDAAQLNQNLFAKLFRFLFEDGVYIPPSSQEAWFLSSAHTEEHIDATSCLIVNFIEKEMYQS